MGYSGTMVESPEQKRLARKRRRHARARDELVEAARQILESAGVAGFTVKAVAEAADISKPAFYYYFPSREHLVAELADHVLSREAAALVEAAYRASSPAGAVAEVLREKVRFYSDDMPAFRMVYLWPHVIGTPDGYAESVVAPRRQAVLDVLTDRLAGATGDIPAGDAARLALATADGLLSADVDAAERSRLALHAAALLERGISR
jgi:AcrR family transcriptional regulator